MIVLWPEASRGDDVHGAADTVRAGARRALGGPTVTAVVGRRCEHVTDTAAAVGTARGALELARLHGADRTVTLPDLGVYGLLLQLNDPTELVRFAGRVLDPLREHDERKNTGLLDTVRVYLDQAMSVARTASELFVHPTTVGLRLKRVEELIDVSLHEPEALLRVKVALMADDVLGGARPAAASSGNAAPEVGRTQGRPTVATRSTRSPNRPRRSSRPGSRGE